MRKHLIMIVAGALFFTAFLGIVRAENEEIRTYSTVDVFMSDTVGDEVDDDVDDYEWSDDDEWMDDDEWPDDDETEPLTDPKTEAATDTAISVEINDVSFDYDVTGGHMTIEVKITGTTSGSVQHCSSVLVTYDENGTMEETEDNDWEAGPGGFERTTMFGYTMEQHFWGTGDGGETDWSNWEFYFYLDGPFDENMSMVDEDELEQGYSALFFVRAFGDEVETTWNQGSKDVTGEITGEKTVDDEDGDDSPIGTVLIIAGFIAAAGVITIISGRRN